MAGYPAEDLLEVEAPYVGRDLGQVFLRNLRGGRNDRILEAMLVAPLVRPQCHQPLADGHEIPRPQQRVPADVFEYVLLFARIGVRHAGAAEECLERVRLDALLQDHAIGFDETDVVDEYLAQALRRVGNVDGGPAILLAHRRAPRQSRVRLLADGGKDFQVVIDAPDLVGDLHQPDLRKVPDIRRDLAGHAGD